MTSSNHRGSLGTLKEALGHQAACVSRARFTEELTAAEREHVQHCPRCQAELALWQEFSDSTPDAEDGAAVPWIVAELRRRANREAEAPAAIWTWLRVRTLSAAAAALVLVAMVGYLTWDREPVIGEIQNTKAVYRTGQLRIVSPVGDIQEVPTVLRWDNTLDAEQYEVGIFEVDRTPLWNATTPGTQIELPPSVSAQLVPGKTVLWEVSARNAAGALIAQSGTQRFRVIPRRPGD